MRITPARPVTPKHAKKSKKERGSRDDWKAIRDLGCIVCMVKDPQIHHVFTGAGGRKDDSKVIPLCVKHHLSSDAGIHGMGRKAWQAIYGTEAELLEQTHNMLVAGSF